MFGDAKLLILGISEVQSKHISKQSKCHLNDLYSKVPQNSIIFLFNKYLASDYAPILTYKRVVVKNLCSKM